MNIKLRNHNLRMVKGLLLFTIITSFLVSCKKDNDIDSIGNQNDYLLSYQHISTVKKSTILLMAVQYPPIYTAIIAKEISDVKAYKINYKTVDVNGEEIEASGAVIIPVTDGSWPVISYQHGTLFNKDEAPSNYSTGLETKGLATILASTGYVVSVPDYLGYGVSSNYPHPYEHAKRWVQRRLIC